MSERATVAVTKAAARAIDRGHPWLWAAQVAAVDGDPAAGELVALRSGGRELGVGYFDPGSPIRARVVSQVSHPLAGDWVRARLDAAIALRPTGVDALRLAHGEADHAPGLVVDRYGPIAVARYDGPGATTLWAAHEPAILAAIVEAGHPVTGLFVRGRGIVVGGGSVDGLAIAEGGARFEVDLERGHKTGLFLDQRPSRERVGELAGGLSVLNLFGYTGGFSIHAGLGGATRVVTVEQAAPAIAAARRNIAASGLDLGDHELVCNDAFDYLAGGPGPFDLVICDPPSFAPSRKSVGRAERAYRSINRLAATAVAPGGLLLTASCSSHVDRRRFDRLVAEGIGDAGRSGAVVERLAAGSDHPVRPGFPEGNYLTVVLVVVD